MFHNFKGTLLPRDSSNEIITQPTVPTANNLITVISDDDIGYGYQGLVIKIGRERIKKKAGKADDS